MQSIRLHFYTLHFKGQKANRVPEMGLPDGEEGTQKEKAGRPRESNGREKEKEVESRLSVSDVLSLAEFSTKFTSFHDIQQLSV